MNQQKEKGEHQEYITSDRHPAHFWLKVLVSVMLCVIVIFIFTKTDILEKNKCFQIVLQVQPQSMVEDETVPGFVAKAEYQGDTLAFIDEEEQYRIKDLLDELNSGEGYDFFCGSDGQEEGKFPVKIEFGQALQKKLASKWKGKVHVKRQEGILTVKNKYGEWDGSKFKKYDGTYVQNDFVESKGEQYYFDAEGQMATGEVRRGFMKYTFDNDGKLVDKKRYIDPEEPMIALTYDDGPGPRTGELLDILEAYDAHATFFMLGQKINSDNGPLLKRMAEMGSEVANHSYNHPDLTKMTPEGMQQEIAGTDQKIAEASGVAGSHLVRPPYGAISNMVREYVGAPMILWSIDTLDWKTMDAQATIDHVMANVGDGDIILMHDIHDPTIDASKNLIPSLLNAGYQLVTISELAEARGITLEPGQSYAEFWK